MGDRRAKNEALFREANERIKQIGDAFAAVDPTPLQFYCECAREGCTEPVELTLTDYEAVRSEPTHFVVVPGHEDPSRERLIERRNGYLVIKKFGEAAETARESDPRS